MCQAYKIYLCYFLQVFIVTTPRPGSGAGSVRRATAATAPDSDAGPWSPSVTRTPVSRACSAWTRPRGSDADPVLLDSQGTVPWTDAPPWRVAAPPGPATPGSDVRRLQAGCAVDPAPQVGTYPANTQYLCNIYTMLVQRRRNWVDVVQMLYKCFVSAGYKRHLGDERVIWHKPSKHKTFV